MKIQTNIITITADQDLNFSQFGTVLDWGLANQGTTLVTVNNVYRLNPPAVGQDASVFSVPYIQDAYRNDRINIKFTGGTGELIVFLTVLVDLC